MNTLRQLTLGVSSCFLSACAGVSTLDKMYQPYIYDTHLYTQSYHYGHDFVSSAPVNVPVNIPVPESYHVGAFRSPTPAKDLDRNWVSSQNPQGYTIEIADDERASRVAGRLYKMPKNDRMAEIKYKRNGKSYYRGVYGTYRNREEAERVLDSLPDNVKQNAGIRNWQDIQNSLSE